MPDDPDAVDTAKFVAARRACAFVEDGMRVGLGTASTAEHMVRCLGEMLRGGKLSGIVGVPTSRRTATLARRVGIPLTTLEDVGRLDLTIDGADEIGPGLTLIKGGGGALLHEKIVAAASDRMVAIADARKRVEVLGAFPLPVEVVPFGWRATLALIEETLAGLDMGGREVALRKDGRAAFETDEGNRIIDCHLGRIADPGALTVALNLIPGVVENGLFVGLCDRAVVGHADGRATVIEGDGASRDEAGRDPGAVDNLFALPPGGDGA